MMATEFKFPDVGEGITEGTLVKWRVHAGEAVKMDQVLCEVETDKAVVELPSPIMGVVLNLNVREGEQIKVGQVLCTIGSAGEQLDVPNLDALPKMLKEKISTPKEVVVPNSEKTTQSAPMGLVLATPHTRQLARDLNVDISKVKGTGNAGRVTDEDVKGASGIISTVAKQNGMPNLDSISVPPTHMPTNMTNLPKAPLTLEGEVTRVPIKGIRKAIMERMVRSFYTAPHASAMDEIDVTELVALREKEKKIAEKKGIKLTYLPFIAKALVNALKEHPSLNASVDELTLELVEKKYYHFGMAVDTDEGLVVPVVKNVDHKSILEIAQEISELAEKARNKNLRLEDVRGSSFTITNYGSMGAQWGVPIINYPDVAILGVGRITEKVVAVRKTKTSKPTTAYRFLLPLTLTFDHRVVDGGQASRFLVKLKEQLEDPSLFLLEVS